MWNMNIEKYTPWVYSHIFTVLKNKAIVIKEGRVGKHHDSQDFWKISPHAVHHYSCASYSGGIIWN